MNHFKTDLGPTEDRPMPSLVELEKAILGACLLDKEAVNITLEKLNEDSFYDDRHKVIFRAIKRLFDNSHPVDLLTVAEAINRSGQRLDWLYLTQISSMVASSANLEYHCLLVLQAQMRRHLIKVAHETQAKAYDLSQDVFDTIEQVEADLMATTNNLAQATQSMAYLIPQALKNLKELSKKKGRLTGVPSGFYELDTLTSGWQSSDLVVLAARPGMGKTSFTLAMALNAALAQIPVAFFSLEMAATQLVTRLVSMELEINSEKLRQGRLTDYDWQLVGAKSEQLSKLPIYIDDTAGINLFELRSKARRLKHKHGVQLIIIDYLQLMNATQDGKPKGNREQEISTISRALKGLAKEIKIPIIALSQLSREVEKRPTKRPQLSDLRESGAIEQDADIVGFIYRPEYYGILEDEDGNPLTGKGEIIIAKHRNGSSGSVMLGWKGEFAKFYNQDENQSIFESLEFKPNSETQEDVPF